MGAESDGVRGFAGAGDGGAVVLDVARVAQLERDIEAAGTSLATLMGCAGKAVADAVMRTVDAPASVAVLAGSGNNGGDGWVAARCLAEAGYRVTLASVKAVGDLAAEPARSTAEAVVRWAAQQAEGGAGADVASDGASPAAHGSLRILEAPRPDEVAAAVFPADAVVDALLGTGFSGTELREPLSAWVTCANEARDRYSAYVVAADAPSGLSAQTGAAASPCVRADETVTMLALKPGLLAPDAATYVGELSCAPLGVDVARFLG